MGKRNVYVGLLVIVGLFFVSACTLPNLRRSQPTPAIPIDLPVRTQGQLRDFDLAVKSIQTQYINQKSADALAAQGVSFRSQVSAGEDDSQFLSTLSSLLATVSDANLSIVHPAAQAAITATSNVTTAFTGIGIMANLPAPDKNRVLVMDVFANSPASEAGLKPHDSIVQIDGKAVTADEGSGVLTRLRGPSGSQVTLTIHTPGKADHDVAVTRRAITTQSTFVSNRVPGTNIGYILPDGASPDAMFTNIAQALRDLSSSQGLDGLILDLRIMQNPDFPVTDLLGLFANGNAGALVTRSGKTRIEITGKNIAGSQELPLVILVSDLTRGVAESYSGILQDLGRARLGGTQTGGQLAVLSTVTLPNTSAILLIPAGEYRGVKDKSWYGSGIKPDIASDLKWEEFTAENDSQLKQAVDALTQR